MTDLHRHPGFDDDRIDPALFDRYVTGTSTLEETAAVQRWASTPERQRLLSDAFAEDGADLTERQARVWAFIMNGMRQVTPASPARMRSALSIGQRTGVLGTQTLRWGVWSAVAAFALGGVMIVAGRTVEVRHVGRRAAMSMLIYTTGNGQRATITLPDGGTVALNVASRLEIPLDYLAGDHTVRLVGEGLFTVPHHVQIPLTVVAGMTTARVLGTSFVVRRYATDSAALVAVNEGKVAVGSTVVTANRLVEVGRDGVPHMRMSDGADFTFATGILTLDDLPLPEAIVELDRWYNADIRLGSPALATQFVQGKFAAGSLADVAEILTFAFNVRVVRDGRILTLYPRV